VAAIVLMALLTAAAAMFGDAILVPITEVGSLAVGVGWLSACAALIAGARHGRYADGVGLAWAGATVSLLIVAMKALPFVPGSFTRNEWIAFLGWCGIGALFWVTRRSPQSRGD